MDYYVINLYLEDIQIVRKALLFYLEHIAPCEEQVDICDRIEFLLDDQFQSVSERRCEGDEA